MKSVPFFLLAVCACCRISEPAIQTNPNNPPPDSTLQAAHFCMRLTDRRPEYNNPTASVEQDGWFDDRTGCIMMNPDKSVWREDGLPSQIDAARSLPAVACGIPSEPVLQSGISVVRLSTSAPVNIASSSAPVDVVVLDSTRTSFELRCGSIAGTSQISLWNGAEAYSQANDSCRISFTVHSDICIPLAGVQIEWRGKLYDMKEFGRAEYDAIQTIAQQRVYIVSDDWLHTDEDTPEEAVTFRIVGPVPYNATGHWLLSDAGDDLTASNGTDGLYRWNKESNHDFNWWPYYGALRPTGRRMYPWEIINRQFRAFGISGAEELSFHKFSADKPDEYRWLKIMVLFGDKSYREYFY